LRPGLHVFEAKATEFCSQNLESDFTIAGGVTLYHDTNNVHPTCRLSEHLEGTKEVKTMPKIDCKITNKELKAYGGQGQPSLKPRP